MPQKGIKKVIRKEQFNDKQQKERERERERERELQEKKDRLKQKLRSIKCMRKIDQDKLQKNLKVSTKGG